MSSRCVVTAPGQGGAADVASRLSLIKSSPLSFDELVTACEFTKADLARAIVAMAVTGCDPVVVVSFVERCGLTANEMVDCADELGFRSEWARCFDRAWARQRGQGVMAVH